MAPKPKRKFGRLKAKGFGRTRILRAAAWGRAKTLGVRRCGYCSIRTLFFGGCLPNCQMQMSSPVTSRARSQQKVSIGSGYLCAMQRAGNLVGHHQDPFHRMLIAQALMEDLTLVSNERAFDAFGASRLW
jgi:hypothetical protein